MIGEREWKEKEERKGKRDQGKRYSKTKRADISVHTQPKEDKGEKWREGAGEVTADEMSTTDKDISPGLWSVEQTNSKQPSKVYAL